MTLLPDWPAADFAMGAAISVLGALLATWGYWRINTINQRLNAEPAPPPSLTPWDRGRMPITVLPPLEASPVVCDALRWGMEWWNDRIGARLFVPLRNLGDGLIVATILEERAEGSVTYTSFTCDLKGQVLDATVLVDAVQLMDLLPARRGYLMAHELGHLLGLAHEDAKRSVMHPEPLAEPVVTSVHRMLLRDAYGPWEG